MKNKKVRLSEEDIELVKESKLKSSTLSGIIKCSKGTIDYHRNRGIWSKRKNKKGGS